MLKIKSELQDLAESFSELGRSANIKCKSILAESEGASGRVKVDVCRKLIIGELLQYKKMVEEVISAYNTMYDGIESYMEDE